MVNAAWSRSAMRFVRLGVKAKKLFGLGVAWGFVSPHETLNRIPWRL